MKNYVIIAVLVIIFLSTTSYAQITRVSINDAPLFSDVPPQVINGELLIPLRKLFETLGATVIFNPKAQNVTICKGNRKIYIRLKPNKNSSLVDAPPIINNRVMVSYGFLNNSFGDLHILASLMYDDIKYILKITHYPSESAIPFNPRVNKKGLIKAVGVDGTNGYVREIDLYGPKPKTPQEALAQQEKDKKSRGRKIPLYAQDGKTIIGEFRVDTGGK